MPKMPPLISKNASFPACPPALNPKRAAATFTIVESNFGFSCAHAENCVITSASFSAAVVTYGKNVSPNTIPRFDKAVFAFFIFSSVVSIIFS